MGTPKAALEWHGSTLLYRTAAVLSRVVSGPVESMDELEALLTQ